MEPPSALAGIRVLDLTRMLAGPFCTALLADLGAEVIKVEPPGTGDDARHFAPRKGGESCYFMLLNRGKKSIALNLKSTQGLALLHALAAKSDVVVENFKPGVTERLKIDYATLSRINPKLVYASISGFGQSGPLSHRPAYDIIAQAMGGIMSVNGPPGGPPMRVGESLGDLAAGLYAAFGILAALVARQATGRGQSLDIAMTDSIFSLMITGLTEYLFTGKVPGPIGSSHPISAPYDTFRVRDGHIIIAVANDPMFKRLVEALGRPELATDRRFKTDPERKRNEVSLRAIIEDWTAERTAEEAIAALEAAAVPASPIWSLDEAASSEHINHRDMLVRVDHPTAGRITLVQQPVQFSDTPRRVQGPPPLLGEHTNWVLSEVLGKSKAEIDHARASDALRAESEKPR